jgi:hypothetical protein
MTRWVMQKAQPGFIIMHANGRGWHTAETLPGIINCLQYQNFYGSRLKRKPWLSL